MQKVVVFGSTGMTGVCAVEAAVQKGLNVRAFVRDPSRLPDHLRNSVEVVKGDVLNYTDVYNAIKKVTAVVVVLGTRNDLGPTTVLSEGMRNIVKAMKELNVEVVSVCLSAFLFYEPDKVPPMFKELNDDHKREFEIVKESGLKYIAVFPPHIADLPGVEYEINHDSKPGRVITKNALGKFLIDCLSQPEHYGKAYNLKEESKNTLLKFRFGLKMLPTRMGLSSGITENPLSVSWHDSTWIPILNTANVMDYFSERSNPFFDRTCNNEIVKMQRLNPDQLQNMTGLEYVLLHVQEPILYVIRKQHRHSPQQVTPLADYYIIAGIVYQAPDLASVLNSRLLSAVHHLQSAFDEASGFSRYHPSKGYSWDFKSQRGNTEKPKAKEEKPREEPSSLFQRQRVDMLLGELMNKFPLPTPALPKAPPPAVKAESENGSTDTKEKIEVKQEKIKPPPEKKTRLS